MPNVHAREKRQLSVWVPVDVYAKFATVAKRNGVPMSEMLVRLMTAQTIGVPLTEAQELEIRRRLRDQTVTVADVAAAVAAEAAAVAVGVATWRPSPANFQPKIIHAGPIPKLGSRKKRKQD